jgi:hypothetical protein
MFSAGKLSESNIIIDKNIDMYIEWPKRGRPGGGACSPFPLQGKGIGDGVKLGRTISQISAVII